MPKINGNEIRPGNVLEHNGGLWVAVKVDHVKPGKGGAFAQVEMKNLRNGSKLNERFRSADKVERVRLEQKDMQFLYETDGMLVFMDTETFDQIELPADILGERRPFLQDGMTIQVEFHESEALSAALPQKVTASSPRCSTTACASACRPSSAPARRSWSTPKPWNTPNAPERRYRGGAPSGRRNTPNAPDAARSVETQEPRPRAGVFHCPTAVRKPLAMAWYPAPNSRTCTSAGNRE